MYVLESCAGQVNPRGLRVPAFVGRVWEPALLYVRVQVELAAGTGWAGNEKFLVQVKAHKLNQLKNYKTRGCTEVVWQHCA